MDSEYIIGGSAFLVIGLYITIQQVKKIRDGKQDKLGFDYKLLGAGIMAIIIGIVFIAKHI